MSRGVSIVNNVKNYQKLKVIKKNDCVEDEVEINESFLEENEKYQNVEKITMWMNQK